jgi:small neutral amino acid transporter SnatA (MarC family)
LRFAGKLIFRMFGIKLPAFEIAGSSTDRPTWA